MKKPRFLPYCLWPNPKLKSPPGPHSDPGDPITADLDERSLEAYLDIATARAQVELAQIDGLDSKLQAVASFVVGIAALFVAVVAISDAEQQYPLITLEIIGGVFAGLATLAIVRAYTLRPWMSGPAPEKIRPFLRKRSLTRQEFLLEAADTYADTKLYNAGGIRIKTSCLVASLVLATVEMGVFVAAGVVIAAD